MVDQRDVYYECLDGYELKDDKCNIFFLYLSNSILIFFKLGLRKVCQDGYRLINQECIPVKPIRDASIEKMEPENVIKEPEFICPVGFKYESGKCNFLINL